MYIAATYSFNNGVEFINKYYSNLLNEVISTINLIDAEDHKTKISREITNNGTLLYNPVTLNSSFKKNLSSLGWKSYKKHCEYPTNYYTKDYLTKYGTNQHVFRNAFREIDFVKNKLGIEIQFGKYAFMAYDILGKMSILSQNNIINAGIEIMPVRALSKTMSTGVSYFEQIVWDLENRGVSNLDIPVAIIGIDA